MHRDSLQTLVYLVATETNPHHLVLRVVSESFLLRSVRSLCQETCDITTDRRIQDLCTSFKIPIERFRERLQLVARILNLIPYEQNYYEILGINCSATPEEIKQSFRRLSFSSHPDINPDDPNAAERFRNIQHAYEVLRNDKLRQSYDQNLGTSVWTEEEHQGGKSTRPVWWWNWRRAWPVGALFLLFMLFTLVIDYREWQTARYYAKMQTQPARQGAAPPSPPPGNSVEPFQEPVRDSGRPSATASLAEPAKTPPTPEPPPKSEPPLVQMETVKPLASAAIANKTAKNDKAPPTADTPGTVGEASASLSAVSSKHTTDAKPLPQKPLPAPAPAAAVQSSGESGGKRSPSEGKPAGAAPNSSARQQTTPSTREGASVLPAEPMVRLQDLNEKINRFLARYSSAYEAKNLSALLHFFEADAVENGKSIQQLVPVYQANFQQAEKLRYRINVQRWEVGRDEVKVDGTFRLSVQFWDESPVESMGSIRLTLIPRGDGFGVKRLDYSFK